MGSTESDPYLIPSGDDSDDSDNHLSETEDESSISDDEPNIILTNDEMSSPKNEQLTIKGLFTNKIWKFVVIY